MGSVEKGPVVLPPAAWDFLEGALGGEEASVSILSEDASFRRYFRVTAGDATYALMEAPPDKEDSAPFVNMARYLKKHGVPAPEIFAESPAQGFYLLEDFGDVTFLKALEAGVEPKRLYAAALDALLDLQAAPRDESCVGHRRPYDRALMMREFALFPDWYLGGIRQKKITEIDRGRFDRVFQRMIGVLLEQPQVLVHRDYHSRNLMWNDGKVGVIDFQDAVFGPITYDLASLLRDCYVAWDAEFRAWALDYWMNGAIERIGCRGDLGMLARDLDWMAVQRNLKAVGIFGRLSLRDGKHGYLDDIPRTMSYVRETLPKYPELAELQDLIATYLPDWGEETP